MDYRGKLQGALRSRSFLRHGAGQGAGLRAASRAGAPCVSAHGWGWQNGEQSSRGETCRCLCLPVLCGTGVLAQSWEMQAESTEQEQKKGTRPGSAAPHT